MFTHRRNPCFDVLPRFHHRQPISDKQRKLRIWLESYTVTADSFTLPFLAVSLVSLLCIPRFCGAFEFTSPQFSPLQRFSKLPLSTAWCSELMTYVRARSQHSGRRMPVRQELCNYYATRIARFSTPSPLERQRCTESYSACCRSESSWSSEKLNSHRSSCRAKDATNVLLSWLSTRKTPDQSL